MPSEIFYRLLSIAFALTMLIGGVVMLYGASQRWPMLVDPPEDLWTAYSQALIKKLFGRKFLLYYTYLMGILFFIGGIYGSWVIITNW